MLIVRNIVFICLLMMSYVGYSQENFSEKVNLALRRTGHLLLSEIGDTTSQIPAVQQTTTNSFILTLNKGFNYDKLPAVLAQSLALHHIENDYDVIIIDSKTGDLVLGYNYQDFFKNDIAPCGGRQQNLTHVQIKVSFLGEIPTSSPSKSPWILGGLATVALLVFGLWRSQKQVSIPDIPLINTSPQLLAFGQSNLDLSNLALQVGDITHTLTYREAKLLQLFAKNPNQVLERNFILQSVWEDEGIVVGRSLDVFVSRLRKLLQPDTSLRIAAVHGVGYRLEVAV